LQSGGCSQPSQEFDLGINDVHPSDSGDKLSLLRGPVLPVVSHIEMIRVYAKVLSFAKLLFPDMEC
jgi:hypothetical protein